MDLSETKTADVVHSDLYDGYLIRILGGDSTPLFVGVPYARKLLKDIAVVYTYWDIVVVVIKRSSGGRRNG